jgi:hypothetical protein
MRKKPYHRRNESFLRRVVDARHEGQPELLEFEDAVGERLVVVQDVEAAQLVEVVAHEALPEGPRLGEARGAHRRELQHVDAVTELPQPRHAEGVGLAIEVQARDLDQVDARVELGIGLPGEDGHLMTEGHQLPGEMAQIDPLPTAVGLGSIGQQGNTHHASLSTLGATPVPDVR